MNKTKFITESQKLSFDKFLSQSLEMKNKGEPIIFDIKTLDDYQKHLLNEVNKGIPENFNQFIVNKINQLQGMLSYEEYTRWFLFQLLIHSNTK